MKCTAGVSCAGASASGGMSYVMAVRANHVVSIGSGRTVTAAGAARMIPHQAWHRMRTGSGTKGTRHYGDARGDQR